MKKAKLRAVGRWVLGPGGFRRPAIRGGDSGSSPRIHGNPSQVVHQSGDPSLAALNNLVTEQLQTTLPKYGGLEGLTSPQPYMRQDYGISGGPETQAMQNLRGFYQGPTVNPYEAQGLSTMQAAADPTRQISAANETFQRITAPSIQNYYTAAGQGRSGAIGEAMANAGAQMALPIANKSADMMSQFGGTLANFGQLQRGREQSNLGALYGMSAFPRMEDAAAQQSGRDTLLGMMTRFPVASGAGKSESSQFIPTVRGGEPPIWQQVMGGVNSAVQIAAMAYGMCWVAEALYGIKDPRFLCAWYQANFAEHGRWGRIWRRAYRRFGPRLAKSKIALAILRPVFYFIARRGARSLGVDLS